MYRVRNIKPVPRPENKIITGYKLSDLGKQAAIDWERAGYSRRDYRVSMVYYLAKQDDPIEDTDIASGMNLAFHEASKVLGRLIEDKLVKRYHKTVRLCTLCGKRTDKQGRGYCNC